MTIKLWCKVNKKEAVIKNSLPCIKSKSHLQVAFYIAFNGVLF